MALKNKNRRILSFFKRFGMNIFLFDMVLFLLYSIAISFDLFSQFNNSFKSTIFNFISNLLILSFSIMYIASMIENRYILTKASKSDKDLDLNKLNINKKIDTKEIELDEDFLKKQIEFLPPIPKNKNKFNQTRFAVRLFIGIYIVIAILYSILIYHVDDANENSIEDILFQFFSKINISPSLLQGIYIYAMALFFVANAFLIALMAGNLTEEMTRTYIFGYHVHESTFGILLVIIGVPLMALAPNYATFSFLYGGSFFVAGIFLIGRDWRDVASGELLVHYTKEEDYEEYIKLEKNKYKILGIEE
ncbi:MAG: hypothetical protein ACTSRZ_10235 [Promethearchaeota archaeon]